MIELGSVKISNGETLAHARVKIRHALRTLGFSDITVTRIETTLSEVLRVAVHAGQEATVRLCAGNRDMESGIAIEIEPVLEAMAGRLQSSVLRRIAPEGVPADSSLCLFRAFYDHTPQLDESLLQTIRDMLTHQTREELTEEISRKNEELSKSQQLLNAVLENIGSAVYAKDMQGRYVYVNHVWETETGRKREEILGLTTAEIFPGDLGRKYREEDTRIIESGSIIKCEDQRVNPDGTITYCLKTGVPMMTDDRMIGLCGLTTDITDRKQMEEELRGAKIIAENAAQSKADFMANMSHEIRTPMNAIVGMTFLLNNTELTTKQKDYTQKILRSSQHLLGIINDILDFSKIEAGKLNIEQTEFRLHVVLENLYNMIGEKCSEKGLELIFDTDPKISDYLCGDPLRLGQVLVNYTNNAVKFTEKGEIIVRIKKIAQDGEQCTLRFEVEDSGIGLTDEQKALLFRPFQQADTSTTRKYGGTGLGLVISKQLATLMGGDVGVESTYGVGSTFWFTACLKERKHKKSPLQSNIDIKGRRVLVVDDNAIARKVLQEMLISLTLRADEADSGKAALEMLRDAEQEKDPYDVIYMDMQMPFMNGIETWKQTAAMQLSHMPRCIIVTAYGREEVFHEAEQAGIAQVLVKPTTPSTLLEATYQALGGSVIYQENEEPDTQKEIAQTMGAIRNVSILLVEDNELNQQVAIELLSGDGVQIDVADNGRIALDMVDQKPYDVVLMDMQMPVMDGFEATRRIRGNPAFAALPIIAMTANAMSEDRERCLKAGMDDFITKPVDPQQLFATLQKWTKNVQGRPLPRPAPPEPAQDEPPANAFPEISIPGLDVQVGLQRILGKKEAYYKILRKFASAQKRAVTEIEEALEKDDRTTAVRIAHTLKGLAGNIGAGSLQEKAAALERVLEENVPEKTLRTAMNETRSMLSFLTHELERVLPPEPEAAVPAGPETAPEKLRAVLEALRPGIVSRKPKKCADALCEYRQCVWPEPLRENAAALYRAVTKYKYKEALGLLDALMKALEGKL